MRHHRALSITGCCILATSIWPHAAAHDTNQPSTTTTFTWTSPTWSPPTWATTRGDDATSAIHAPGTTTQNHTQGTGDQLVAGATHENPADYWTPQRMRSATPVTAPDTTTTTRSTTPWWNRYSTDQLTAAGTDRGGVIANATTGVKGPTTVGKFFFTNTKGEDKVCSATAINNSTKNLVMTAGHCVYTAKVGWHSNMAYAPGYHNGTNPNLGVWSWASARTFAAYQERGWMSHDQAFITVQPRNGKQLIDVTGGNGLIWGQSTTKNNVRVWGYPILGKYRGNRTAVYCDGNAVDRAWFNPDTKIACDMTGGASGGPWFTNQNNNKTNQVYAITSRRSTIGQPSLYATPNAKRVKTMFDQM